MTNPHRGDLPLVVADKTYTVRYSHAALVKLEQQQGKGLFRVMQEMTQPEHMRIETVAAMLWAGLQKHHPTVTLDDAINMLDDIEGGARGAMDVLGEAMQRAFNAPGTKGTNPPAAGATNGTGMPSSSSTSASATTPTPSGRLPPESASST